MDFTFEALMQKLRNDDGSRFTKYLVEDMDGNQIQAEKLFILDFYAMLNWLVEEIAVDDFGRIAIVLNGGNFKAFHFRNVNE